MYIFQGNFLCDFFGRIAYNTQIYAIPNFIKMA